MGEGIRRFQGLSRQTAFVIDLIQDHAHGICIHSIVEYLHIILYFPGGIGAAVFAGKGGEGQGIQFYKPQIADTVLLLSGKEDIGRFQVNIHVSGPAADGKCCTQVKTQVDSLQMCDGLFAHITQKRSLVAAQKIDLVTESAVFHGNDLAAFVGEKSFQFGKHIERIHFCGNGLCSFLEVVCCFRRILVCTGQKQCIQLDLRHRNRDYFYNVFLICIFLHGRIAANAVMVTHGTADDKSVQ